MRTFNENEGPENNPVLLWLYNHGWEDPDWGHNPVAQLVTGLIIHQLANRIVDREMGDEIRRVAGKVIEVNAGKIAASR